jgi:rare lipoprotein A
VSAPPSKGGYYKDDGPGDNVPGNLASIPDAEPRIETLSRFANRPYEVFGKRYVPLASVQPFRERGLASWYGKRFHGQKTSSGERYDMYAMTAAHKTLPIPSYARVTRVGTGRSVIVRINDRGPFHAGRVIDLSYAAAYRLGLIGVGSAEVEVEAIVPGSTQGTQSTAAEPVPVAAAAVQPIATTALQAEPLAAVEPAAAPPSPSPSRGVFLQVGAFSSRDNAEKLRARLSSSQEKGELVQLDSLWRVQIGPYGSQDEARSAAERLEPTLGLKPLVVVR